METTMQSSFSGVRNKIALIEAIELATLGFAVWFLATFNAVNNGESIIERINILIGYEVVLLGSWAIYNGYIRVARAGGRIVDFGLWWIAAPLTGTYTFWAWSILDINRLIIQKLFYRGDAPVEFAWSWRSKQVRKAWEQGQNVRYV